jgi:K+-sensing histidine kinase KdpD
MVGRVSPPTALGEGPGVGAITFTVADTGIGMTEEQQTRLFQAFPRPRPIRPAASAARGWGRP